MEPVIQAHTTNRNIIAVLSVGFSVCVQLIINKIVIRETFPCDHASDKMKGQALLLNPSAGVSFRLSDKTLVNLGLGYERQGATRHYTVYFIDIDGSTTLHYIYHSFTLNSGFTF